ncbi:hypothetical protein OROHE_000853 [Orobanche hederae]
MSQKSSGSNRASFRLRVIRLKVMVWVRAEEFRAENFDWGILQEWAPIEIEGSRSDLESGRTEDKASFLKDLEIGGEKEAGLGRRRRKRSAFTQASAPASTDSYA